MLELDKISAETFAPYLHHTFRVEYGASESLQVELSELNLAAERLRHNGRLPFSLIFRGGRDRYLPQQVYRIAHDALGSLNVFLVPIGPDAEGIMRYEAVFG